MAQVPAALLGADVHVVVNPSEQSEPQPGIQIDEQQAAYPGVLQLSTGHFTCRSTIFNWPLYPSFKTGSFHVLFSQPVKPLFTQPGEQLVGFLYIYFFPILLRAGLSFLATGCGVYRKYVQFVLHMPSLHRF